MKKLLIVSPRFAPVNAPDQHRVRMSLPYFTEFGWRPTVLAVTPESINDSIIDPLLLESIPQDADIRRVSAWREPLCRRFGFGHLDYRCFVPLYRAGTRLLQKDRYDVIYFSTTAFSTFLFGPLWRRRFGCKVVFDFQDPWYQGDEHPYDPNTAPGGWNKYRASQMLSRYGERFAMRAADHIISVSDGYVRTLSRRYPQLQPKDFTVFPFGISPLDHKIAQNRQFSANLFDKREGEIHWVYAGRGGPDISPVFEAFFQGLRRLKQDNPEFARRLKVHFVGTNYSPAHRTSKVVEPIAAQVGVADLVIEHSIRIPYFQAISLMADSDATLLFGSVSSEYTASKLFNCLFSGRPLLAFCHADSLVSKIITRFLNAHLAVFRDHPSEADYGMRVKTGIDWLVSSHGMFARRDDAFEPYLAKTLTGIQCGIFDRLIGQ